MGCWNGTCAISNLPILGGDDVKLLITKFNRLSNDTCKTAVCYVDDIFKPRYLQLDAQYDTYGSVENIVEDWNYEIICSDLIKPETKIKADGKIIKDPTLYDFIRAIERGKLEIFNDNIEEFKLSDLSFLMVRKDIWDYIVSNFKGECWKPAEERTSDDDYYESEKESLTRIYNSYKDKYKKYNNKLLIDADRFVMHYNFPNRIYNDYLVRRDSKNNFINIDNEDIFNTYLEFYLIKGFMNATRKHWNIVSGAGSQNLETPPYKVLINAMEIGIDNINIDMAE